MSIILVGITGGSGSGKTTLTLCLGARLGGDNCVVISQDDYFKDLRDRIAPPREFPNFDEPDAVDFRTLRQDLLALKSGKTIEMPLYDFHTHFRRPETRTVIPKPIIIVEGILILADPMTRQLFDYTYMVDCPEDLRFYRRRKRDVETRGRTLESVNEMLEKFVRPSHNQYVEPLKTEVTEVLSQDECVEDLEKLADRLIQSWH